MLLGSPAGIAWPHGEAGAATIAPGNVLSSDALITFADSMYRASSWLTWLRESPAILLGGDLSEASYLAQPAS